MDMEGHREVEDYLQYLAVERGHSKNSLLSYGRDVRRFLEDLKKSRISLDSVDTDTVSEHVGSLQSQGKSARSAARALSAVKSFFRYLVSVGRLTADRVSDVQSPRLRKSIPGFLDLSQITRLIDSIPTDTPAGLRDRAMLELLYGAGLRVSELCGLLLSQLDLDHGFVTVVGKGDKERTVPIGRAAVAALSKYVKHARKEFLNGQSTDRVFLSRRGLGWTRQGVWKWLRGVAKSSGLDIRLYPHLLRHTFATHVLSGGADLRSVQELLGHADISTTEIYTHLDTPRLRKIHQQYHPRA